MRRAGSTDKLPSTSMRRAGRKTVSFGPEVRDVHQVHQNSTKMYRSGSVIIKDTPSTISEQSVGTFTSLGSRPSTTTAAASERSESQRVPIRFINKYDKIRQITPDQLEILARKLLENNLKQQMKDQQRDDQMDQQNRAASIQATVPSSPRSPRHTSRRSLSGKTKHHLLQETASRKAECVSFGLQLVNSVKHVTQKMSELMGNFSDGINDLLRICQQFMELIIGQLPRQVLW